LQAPAARSEAGFYHYFCRRLTGGSAKADAIRRTGGEAAAADALNRAAIVEQWSTRSAMSSCTK
jgi:hypothetical protein